MGYRVVLSTGAGHLADAEQLHDCQQLRDEEQADRQEAERDIGRESRQRDRIAGLRALLSYAYWDELRRHERLAVAAATRTLSASIHALLRS